MPTKIALVGPVLITLWMLVVVPAVLIVAGFAGSLLLDFAMKRAQSVSVGQLRSPAEEDTG